MTIIEEIPRRTLRAGLTLARLPLTTAEAALGHRGDESWTPALVFDQASATVKQAVGSVLHDDDLVAEGRLTAAKVDELRRALTLEATAEQRRAAAAEEFDERRAEAAERAEQAEERAQQREQAIDKDAAAKEREVAEKADRRREASERAEEATTEAVERRARAGRRAALAEEEEALDKERAATTGRRQAQALDQGIKAQKAKRAAKR